MMNTACRFFVACRGWTGELAVAAVLLAAVPGAAGDVTLPSFFGDHMVLQCDKPIRIWGWADAGEKVAVTLAPKAGAKQTARTGTATADAKGDWAVMLEPVKAGFEPWTLAVGSASGGTQRVLSDVLIGEVWLCGGQSNMESTLRGSLDADVELPSLNYPAIRFIRLPKVARLTPQRDVPAGKPTSSEGHWRLCVPKQAENCTAVGYYFARRLHRRLKVPVGLIDTSWGGTMAQHWVPKDVLRTIPEVKPYLETFQAKLDAWTAGGGAAGAKTRYAKDVKDWEAKLAAAKAAGDKRLPRKPNSRAYQNPADQGQPGGMFNGLIAPLAPMTLRGALFYQGENNSFSVGWKPFPKTFPAVIASWRKAFGNDKLPFGIIQIAGWSTRRSMTYDMNHHTNIVREIQLRTWQGTANTGLVVTYDTNSRNGIHPACKEPVGQRSARWALAEVYGVKRWNSTQPLRWRGPVYKSMAVADSKIVVSFEPETAESLRLDQDDECGFYIAGADRTFHHARAKVNPSDRTVTVWSDAVPKPVAARYSWSNLPVGRLMNGRELPAYPFRTDTWPLTPHQSTGSYVVGGK